jgi:hypothetical protein
LDKAAPPGQKDPEDKRYGAQVKHQRDEQPVGAGILEKAQEGLLLGPRREQAGHEEYQRAWYDHCPLEASG